MSPRPGPIGSSLPMTPVSSSVNSTRQWKADRALAVRLGADGAIRLLRLIRASWLSSLTGQMTPSYPVNGTLEPLPRVWVQLDSLLLWGGWSRRLLFHAASLSRLTAQSQTQSPGEQTAN